MKRKLLAIGEALIDFIPFPSDCGIDEVEYFSPAVGGAPANVCAAFSAAGGASALLSMLADDPFGRKIERFLKEHGVGTEYIRFTDRASTALAFVTLSSSGQRDFSFYRSPSADMLYSAGDVEEAAFEDAFALHFCSVCLCDFPVRSAHVRAIELAEKSQTLVSFDPNLRFPLWKSKKELFDVVWRFVPRAHVLKLSDEELPFLYGGHGVYKEVETTAAQSAENKAPSAEDSLSLVCALAREGRLFCGENRIVLLSCGAQGAYAFIKYDGEKRLTTFKMRRQSEVAEAVESAARADSKNTAGERSEAEKALDAHKAYLLEQGVIALFAPAVNFGPAIDTTGAGDAFVGAFLRSLEAEDLDRDALCGKSADIEEIKAKVERALAFAARFSGMSVTKKGAIASYPHMFPEG